MSIEARLNTHNSSHGEHPQPQYGISSFSNWHLSPGGCSFFGEEGEGGREGDRQNAGESLAWIPPCFGRGWSPSREESSSHRLGYQQQVHKGNPDPDKTPQPCSWGSSFRTSCSWLNTLRSPVHGSSWLNPSVSKGCCTPTWRCLS